MNLQVDKSLDFKQNFPFSLPDDLMCTILSFLSIPNIVKLSEINKTWNDICKSDDLWENIFKNHFLGEKLNKTYYESFLSFYHEKNIKTTCDGVKNQPESIIPNFKCVFKFTVGYKHIEVFKNLLFINYQSNLECFSLNSFKSLWIKDLGYIRSIGMRYSILNRSLLFVSNSHLISFDDEGKLIWKRKFERFNDYKSDFNNYFFMKDEKIYLISSVYRNSKWKDTYLQIQIYSVKTGNLLDEITINSTKRIYEIINVFYYKNKIIIEDQYSKFIFDENTKELFENKNKNVFIVNGEISGYGNNFIIDTFENNFLIPITNYIYILDEHFNIKTKIFDNQYFIVSNIVITRKFYYYIGLQDENMSLSYKNQYKYSIIALNKNTLTYEFISDLNIEFKWRLFKLSMFHNKLFIELDNQINIGKVFYIYEGVLLKD